MKEGKITKWLKKEGDKVSSGEAIAECETDKSNLEIEAYDDGFLLKILVKEGDMAPVGSPIAMIGAKGEKVEVPVAAPAAAPAAPGPAAPPAAVSAPPAPKAAPAAPAARTAPATVVPLRAVSALEDGRLRVSPLARKMASSEGLDLGMVQGSGPQGRIVKRDIEAAMSGGGKAATAKAPAFVPAPVLLGVRHEPRSTPVSSMRKVISQRMSEVKPGVPHFYVSMDVEMDEVMKLREDAKASGLKVSVNDVIVKAAGVALRRYPKINVSLQGDQVVQFQNADVGIAVALEEGLITPVIKDADQKPLASLGEEARSLAERARKRALKPDEYSGGSVTISNLGMFGVNAFIAVINPPQSAIVAVGTVEPKAVVRNGQLVVRQMMTATLSGDHRVIDGATGAEYLRELKTLLEKPTRLLF
jgi:pyruvate dehydrogenase E2 component (dihydrolipoamide acetyltransferase)